MIDDPKRMTKEEAFSKWLNPMPELIDPRYYAGRDPKQRAGRSSFATETPMPIGEMEEPEDIVIPQFLSPSDPLDSVPESLLDLVEPEETAEQMQARLWALWRELNGKLMLGLASAEEIALHTKLHNELHWFAPPVEGE